MTFPYPPVAGESVDPLEPLALALDQALTEHSRDNSNRLVLADYCTCGAAWRDPDSGHLHLTVVALATVARAMGLPL